VVGSATEVVVELLQKNLADLGGSLASQVRALLDEAFPDRPPGEAHYVEYGTPPTILVLRDRGRAVGHLALCRREVGVGAETLAIGMIGDVAIAPDYRGRGHTHALFAHAHAHLTGQSLPFSVLFAYEPRVYASRGYNLMQNETRFLDADGAWKTFVFRGSMYAELSGRRWPNQLLDLRGRVV
jgi:predicted acetyltransferase